MRNIFFVAAGLAAMVVANASAGNPIGQPITPDIPISGSQTFIPGSFTKDGAPMLTYSNFDRNDGSTNIKVVDAFIESVADLDIPELPEAMTTRRWGRPFYTMHWTSVVRDTLNKETFDLTRFLSENNYYEVSSYYTSEGAKVGTIFANWDTSFEELPSGIKAIKKFLIKAEEFVLVSCEGECKINTLFDPEEQSTEYEMSAVQTLSCFDYDKSGVSLGKIGLTQTLFNDDEAFEYVSPIYEQSEFAEGGTLSYEAIWDFGDFAYAGYNLYETIYPEKCTGFTIKNQEGEVLQTIYFEDGLYALSQDDFMSLIMIGGNKYLSCMLRGEKLNNRVLYAIKKDGTGVNQVASFKTNVSPTLVRNDESVYVNSDGLHQSSLSVEAYDLSGKVLYKGHLNSGENSLSIPARTLSEGMNVVTVSDGRQKSSTKVLVK